MRIRTYRALGLVSVRVLARVICIVMEAVMVSFTHQMIVLVHHPLDVRQFAVEEVDAPPLVLVRGVVAHASVLLLYALLYALWKQ